jgi:hypothetical protein
MVGAFALQLQGALDAAAAGALLVYAILVAGVFTYAGQLLLGIL